MTAQFLSYYLIDKKKDSAMTFRDFMKKIIAANTHQM